MKRLSKQKRDQLILVCIVTLAVLAALWFLVIRSQKESLQSLRAQKVEKDKKAESMRDKVKSATTVKAQADEVDAKLAEKETDMVSGDYYASLVNTIRKFKLPYKLDIPQFSPAASVTDVDLLPKFPYKQVRIVISGNGYYEEIGKFIADFENEYATSRIVNLELTPYSGPIEAREKLTFRMEIVSLVASGVTVPTHAK
jgi:Tfp pilus assembly protein PilO